MNAQRLLELTPIPVEPQITLTPKTTELPIGTLYTLTAKVVNLADKSRPMRLYSLEFRVKEGPHMGEYSNVFTDLNGEAQFSYIGTKIGTDKITVRGTVLGIKKHRRVIRVAALGNVLPLILANVQIAQADNLDMAEVHWTAGPDLTVPLFVPPLIKSQGGQSIFLTDVTKNYGTYESAPSTTRYYLSSSLPPFDINTATVLGERLIPVLGIKEFSEANQIPHTLPAELPEGTYTLAACADANQEVVELDEDNNCSFNQLDHAVSIVVPIERPTNLPPDCSQASANTTSLWPPNHKLATIEIEGVTDPEGNVITIRIDSITQDEPVNGLGDGDTSPDGFGIGAVQAQLRAERSGTGNGRVYAIGFTAQDDQGESCTSTVQVGVPHDQGKGNVPIDDGQGYDSTVAVP